MAGLLLPSKTKTFEPPTLATVTVYVVVAHKALANVLTSELMPATVVTLLATPATVVTFAATPATVVTLA